MVLFTKFGHWLGCKDDFWEYNHVPSEHGALSTVQRSTEGPFMLVLPSWEHYPPTAPDGGCGVCPQFLPPLLSPTQQEAPSILAQPKSAMTSAPGTDQSWTSRRVTLSRSLTRRGNKAGGEGRSMAGWVRAEPGISGILATVKLYWN